MDFGSGSIFHRELGEFNAQIDQILAGQGRGRELREFGAIYWDEEEASFLRISNDLDQFYIEMLTLLSGFLTERGISFDESELQEVVKYQKLRIPTHSDPVSSVQPFQFNIPEYFETCFRSDAQPLRRRYQELALVDPRDYEGNKFEYAKESILWGRKSGTMLTDVSYTGGVLETTKS